MDVVSMCICHFVREQRNYFSAEAIATELDSVPNLTVEIVEAILAELRASGDFDRIIADAKASMARN